MGVYLHIRKRFTIFVKQKREMVNILIQIIVGFLVGAIAISMIGFAGWIAYRIYKKLKDGF